MKHLFSTLLITITFPTMVIAADYNNGQQLHADQCTRCHDDSLYTRENRRVQSLKGLNSQVHLCKNNIGIQWFDDEVDDVVHYLNQKYYHF